MLSDPLFLLVLLAVAIVAGVLLAGVAGFGKAGEAAGKRSNKLMQYRIVAQFVAVGLILLYVYLRRGG